MIIYPKNPDPSKLVILMTWNPAIQIEKTLPLKGPICPIILRVDTNS